MHDAALSALTILKRPGAENSGKGSIRDKDASPSSNDPAVRLRKIKELLDEGLLTQAEYDAEQAEIINSIWALRQLWTVWNGLCRDPVGL